MTITTNQALRRTTAILIAPLLRVTGLRFSKRHRHENTLTYRLVDTVRANSLALRPEVR